MKLIFALKMGKSKNLGFSNFEGNNKITWFCYGHPYKLYFTICDLEDLLTSLLLIPHLWDSTLNEPSLNKTFESEEIFHLFSTQYSVLIKQCTLQWPWKTTNFSSLLMPYLWESTSNEPSSNKTSKSEEIFHVSNTQYSQYSVLINHCTLLWPRRTTNFFIINATPIR